MTNETFADIIAEMRKLHDEICARCNEELDESCPYCGDPNGCNSPDYGRWSGIMTQLADRLEAVHKRERILAVSIMRSKLYGIAGGLRAITARSDARQRGIHYTEVQNIAAQIENIADNGGEA